MIDLSQSTAISRLWVSTPYPCCPSLQVEVADGDAVKLSIFATLGPMHVFPVHMKGEWGGRCPRAQSRWVMGHCHMDVDG